MKKIDRETVQRILDTADIVEVVGDFVNLKRRGSNYMGLCPFHNERTPSFSVSKAKNICKCFSCGKGGSPVNFIMELEQMSYNEALRYLAQKYNIEIHEEEVTDEERERESERASMLAVNEFALKHFEHNLYETSDGRSIGLSYFYERGLNDSVIKKFRLGYASEQSTTPYNEAVSKGYSEKYLIDTGLCIRTENGRVYDRFKGRVTFPVLSVSGKVVAFGGRALKKDIPAKYVNSPESLIYHKSNQLYGIYQAKPSIVKKDKCILVEGYMDVISMFQSGIENVVASSGTSLTEGQIRLIHRFTDNVTVIYDGDSAGIKASLRGIDMLLSEGLNIKVLLLPDGDDPDSFSRKHSSTELEEYIRTHETDFIQFKTDILLQGVANDPIARAKVINDIVRSISVIPEAVTRNIYIQECSRRLDINERVISLEVSKQISALAENADLKRRQQTARESIADIETAEKQKDNVEAESADNANTYTEARPADIKFLRPYEKKVLQYALRYGMLELCKSYDEAGNATPVTVLEYITSELAADELTFINRDVADTFDEARTTASKSWAEDNSRNNSRLLEERALFISEGESRIRNEETDMASIERREKRLIEEADERYFRDTRRYAALYLEKTLTSHSDNTIRNLTLELVSDKHVLSKVHTKYAKIETDEDRLDDLVPRTIYEYKDAILECRIRKLHDEIKAAYRSADADNATIMRLMETHVELQRLRGEFAKYLGERTINPRK